MNPVSTFRGKVWKSREVPGHLVRAVTETPDGSRQIDELVDFAAVRK